LKKLSAYSNILQFFSSQSGIKLSELLDVISLRPLIFKIYNHRILKYLLQTRTLSRVLESLRKQGCEPWAESFTRLARFKRIAIFSALG